MYHTVNRNTAIAGKTTTASSNTSYLFFYDEDKFAPRIKRSPMLNSHTRNLPNRLERRSLLYQHLYF